jgi:hypothetical protein
MRAKTIVFFMFWLALNLETTNMKYIKRILSAPFIFGILVITHNWFAIRRTIQFIQHGGECIIYDKDDRTTIHELYNVAKENINKK